MTINEWRELPQPQRAAIAERILEAAVRSLHPTTVEALPTMPAERYAPDYLAGQFAAALQQWHLSSIGSGPKTAMGPFCRMTMGIEPDGYAHT